MQWKCLPIPHDTQGKPAIHYTTVYKVFARWADDGSLWQAFVASVRHLAAEKHLDLSVLHGDGTNTVAKKGVMALASRGTNTKRARRALPSSTIMLDSGVFCFLTLVDTESVARLAHNQPISPPPGRPSPT